MLRYRRLLLYNRSCAIFTVVFVILTRIRINVSIMGHPYTFFIRKNFPRDQPWPGKLFRPFTSAGFRQPYPWLYTSGAWALYLYSQVNSLNHLSYGLTVSCVYHRPLIKEGEVIDGWWDLYPHARVTIPVDWLDPTRYLQITGNAAVGGTFLAPGTMNAKASH